MSFLLLYYVKCWSVRNTKLFIMQDRPIGTKCWPYMHQSLSPRHVLPVPPSCQQLLYSYIKRQIWHCIYVERANTCQSILLCEDKQWQKGTTKEPCVPRWLQTSLRISRNNRKRNTTMECTYIPQAFFTILLAVPCLRQLLAGFWPRRLAFGSMLLYVGFVVDEVLLRRTYL
jgi:hypothetical protein